MNVTEVKIGPLPFDEPRLLRRVRRLKDGVVRVHASRDFYVVNVQIIEQVPVVVDLIAQEVRFKEGASEGEGNAGVTMRV